jgi:hypothetical protein
MSIPFATSAVNQPFHSLGNCNCFTAKDAESAVAAFLLLVALAAASAPALS